MPKRKTWNGSKDLESLLIPLGKIRNDPDNLNNHTPRSIDVLKASLGRFGQQKPVVALKDGTVKAGNGMLQAATDLGWTHLAVATFAGTAIEAKAFGIADNQSTRHSFFTDGIIDHVVGMMDAFSPDELGGWDPSELDGFEMPPSEDSDEGDADDGSRVSDAKSIRVTQDQWVIIHGAIEKIRDVGDEHLSEGRCLELICADFISGSQPRAEGGD